MSTFTIEGDFDLVTLHPTRSDMVYSANVKEEVSWTFTIPGAGTWSFGFRILAEHSITYPSGNMKAQISGGAGSPAWTTVANRGLAVSGSDATPRPWSFIATLDDTTGGITYLIVDPDGVVYGGTQASVCPGGLHGLAQVNTFFTSQGCFWDSSPGYVPPWSLLVRHRINSVDFREDGTLVVSEDFPDTTFSPPWDAQSSADAAPKATWGVSDATYLHFNTDTSISNPAGTGGSTYVYLQLLNVIPASFANQSIAMKLVSPTEVVCVRNPRTTPGSESVQIEYTRLFVDGAQVVSFPSEDYAAQTSGGVSLALLGPELFGSFVMDSPDGAQQGVGVRVDRATPTAWTFSTAASALAIPGICRWAEIAALPAGAGLFMVMQAEVSGDLKLYLSVATDYYAGNLIFIVPVALTTTSLDFAGGSLRTLPDGRWLLGLSVSGFAIVIILESPKNDGSVSGVGGATPVLAGAKQIELEACLSLVVAMVLEESGGVYTWKQSCGVWTDGHTLSFCTAQTATGIVASSNVRGSLVSLPDGALLFAMIDDSNATRFWRCTQMPKNATGTWTEVVAP
jgi:hypothetical protein